MSFTITYNFTANVSGGPSLTVSDSMDVEAYNPIEVAVPGGGATTIAVQPGTGGELLVITASEYEDITYKVDGGTAQTLNGPHILIGSGAVALLGATQNEIEFTNAGSDEITVYILVGRDATP